MSGPHSVTIGIPHYKQWKILKRQLDHFEKWIAPLGGRVQLFFVDDGSGDPDRFSATIQRYQCRGLNVKGFIIEEDVPYNMPGANNIALRFADTDWFFRTDMDHLIPPELIKDATHRRPEKGLYYTFQRTDGEFHIESHKNTLLLPTNAFRTLGGYDETFSGSYGCDDEDVRRRLDKAGYAFQELSIPVLCFNGAKADTHRRDVTRNQQILETRIRYPPHRGIQNMQLPFVQVMPDQHLMSLMYHPSALPPLMGLMITRNDLPVMGSWLAAQAYLYERVFVLDGSDEHLREPMRRECTKYPWVEYVHEKDLKHPVQPTDHDLRIPGLQWIREHYGRGNWIAILHPDEFFIQDPHIAVRKAIDERKDHVRCRVLEVLPESSEEKQYDQMVDGIRSQPDRHHPSPIHLFQQAWGQPNQHVFNHYETRFFHDHDGVEYVHDQNGMAAPLGLTKGQGSLQPLYAHFKCYDPKGHLGSAYSTRGVRSDHFGGSLVGLKVPLADVFRDKWPFVKKMKLHQFDNDMRVKWNARSATIPPDALVQDRWTWHSWYHARKQGKVLCIRHEGGWYTLVG